MDRSSPLFGAAVFYSAVCAAFTHSLDIPKHLQGKDKRDFIGQHVSFVHCCFAVVLSAYSYYQDNGIDYDLPYTTMHLNVLMHTLGYMLYDSFYAEIFSLHDWTMRMHHFVGFAGGVALSFCQLGGSMGCCKTQADSVLLAEVTNPFMEARLILKARKEEDTKTYKIVEAIFALGFVFIRVPVAFFLSLNVWCSEIDPLVCLSVSGVVAVGWFWSYTILCLMAKKAKGKENLFLRGFVRMVEIMRANQMALRTGIVLSSIGFPILWGKVWRLGYVQFRVHGFQVI